VPSYYAEGLGEGPPLDVDLVPGQLEVIDYSSPTLPEDALPIVYPMVARDKARIRTQLCSDHTKEQLDRALEAFKEGGRKLGLI